MDRNERCFFYMEWSTQPLKGLLYLPVLVKKPERYQHSRLMVSQRLCLSTVPAFWIAYVLPLSLCLSNEAKQGWQNEERRMKANLWFCGITVFVGFYRCSQM